MDWQALYEALHHGTAERALQAAQRLGSSAGSPVRVLSACLLGVACRYDGMHKGELDAQRLLEGRAGLPLCPEVLAGLGVPRPPMVFEGGDGAAALRGQATLVNVDGRDCTALLAEGAAVALQLAQAAGCDSAVLKARSPSCGVHRVHTQEGLVAGRGMFAALCVQAGITVHNEEEILRRP